MVSINTWNLKKFDFAFPVGRQAYQIWQAWQIKVVGFVTGNW